MPEPKQRKRGRTVAAPRVTEQAARGRDVTASARQASRRGREQVIPISTLRASAGTTARTTAGAAVRAAAGCLLLVAASTAALAQSVPGIKRDLDFDAMMKGVDLDDPALTLVYKLPTSDGTSVGFFIGRGGEKPNASFVPTNNSSIPEAEVVSYRLARFLGVSRNYYPVDYYKLGPKAMARFTDMVMKTPETEDDRIANRKLVLKQLKADPTTILGIYRIKPKTKMYAARSLGTQGQFNLNTGISAVLRANGPMPTDKMMPLDGVKGGQPGFPAAPMERQVEIARQLSNIFVIDQLLGQWDRFWENLEASGDKNGRLKLVARDNGGATLDDWEDYEIYNRWVSRYDRPMIDKLTALNAFLKGEAKEFAGYTSPDAWKTAVGFIVPSSFDAFKAKLSRLIDQRLPALVKQHGDKAFLPAKAADVVALDAADTGEDD